MNTLFGYMFWFKPQYMLSQSIFIGRETYSWLYVFDLATKFVRGQISWIWPQHKLSQNIITGHPT